MSKLLSFKAKLMLLIAAIIIIVATMCFGMFRENEMHVNISYAEDLPEQQDTFNQPDNVSFNSAEATTKGDKQSFNNLMQNVVGNEHDFDNLTFINNSNYFYLNPAHGNNVQDPVVEQGVCTTVAVDLLMGYHNYFSDRRLIPETDGNGTRFLAENYGDLTYHPYDYFGDPVDPYLNDVNNRLLNSSTALGTDVGFFETLLELQPFGENILGQMIFLVAGAAEDFVEEYAPSIQNNVSIESGLYSKDSVCGELAANRPAIIGLAPINGMSGFHVTVAYGHAYYNGNFGYIVHAGWRANKTKVWIDEKYVMFQITMNVNHTHNMQSTWEYLGDDTSKWIYECSTCGYKERDEIFNLDTYGMVITGIHNQCPDSLTIPDVINGNLITAIGNGAFANNDTIEEINIADTVETIGANAFENCSELSSVNFNGNGSASNLYSIGNSAFNSCSSLGNMLFPRELEYIGANAFEGCVNLTGFMQLYGDTIEYIGNSAFAGCDKLETIALSSTLTTIGANAFNNCTSLATIFFPVAGSQLTTIENAAFANCNSLVSFDLSETVTHIGYDAFNGCWALEDILLRDELEFIGGNAFKNCTSLTIYAEDQFKPAAWISSWNISSRPVFWGCVLDSESDYIVSFVKSSSNPENINAANGIIDPKRDGYNFGGWCESADGSGDVYESVADAPNGILYTCWIEKACVADGTMITLADGSQKAVEDLTGDEMLLVWNMFTGEFDSAPILFIDSEPAAEFEVIKLTFSDGTVVDVIDEHAFWNFDLNEYVFIREDAAKYIGDTFNRQTYNENGEMSYSAVQLTDVDIVTEYTTAWSPVTYGHLCYYVNGMLSMPGATEGLINIFEVDPDTMTIDSVQYAADIAEYGLYTYDEFVEEVFELPLVMFEAFNGQYMKVAIGKGLITVERLTELFARYGELF